MLCMFFYRGRHERLAAAQAVHPAVLLKAGVAGAGMVAFPLETAFPAGNIMVLEGLVRVFRRPMVAPGRRVHGPLGGVTLLAAILGTFWRHVTRVRAQAPGLPFLSRGGMLTPAADSEMSASHVPQRGGCH